ncbi:hypothetical protein IU433_10965 [Nocardia puris]|nr:hypothetical protein [Nocardia puris]MBF6364628.1 hypothetical protein [Nocardia puris]MBF6459557.1 hypothetical protein [Nocardia puris]
MVAIAAVGIAGGTANALPAPVAPPGGIATPIIPGVVNYTATNDGTSAIITTDVGALTVVGGQFQITDAEGRLVGGVPLEVTVDEIAYPVKAEITGNTAKLTPTTEGAYFRPALSAAKEISEQTAAQREQAAWQKLGSRLSVGAAVGALVGAVGASAVGCVAGGVLGGALTAPVALLLGGGPIAGCIAGAVMLAPVGTIAGALLVGVPVAIAGAIEYFSTVTAPLPPAAPAK